MSKSFIEQVKEHGLLREISDAFSIGEVSIEKINYYKEEQNNINTHYLLLEQLSELRKNKKLSQRELASIVCMKQPMLAKIEKGKNFPQLNILLNILDSLGYTIKYEKKQS